MNEGAPLLAVVDDDESVRRALSRLLRCQGYRVEAFASAAELLEIWSVHGFACLVVDIHLGGMSGLDLMDRLPELGCRVPVIIITAHDEDSSQERAARGGASAFLRKPLDAPVLIAEVQRAMSRPPAA